MKLAFLYIFLFLCFSPQLFCQDVIVKKDSTRIFSNIHEINSFNIIYSEFGDRKHKKHLIPKNEVAKIIFRNKDEIKYNEPLGKHSNDTLLTIFIKQKTRKPSAKVLGDYIKFNLTLGAVFNSSDSNRPLDNDTAGKKGVVQYRYEKIQNQDYKAGFNFGFNFLLGGSPYIKHIFGINFLQSGSNYMFIKNETDPNSTSYYQKSVATNLNIKGFDCYVNVVNGVRLTFFKTLHIDACVTLCVPALNKSHINGTEVIYETGKSDIQRNITDSIGNKSHVTTPSLAFNPKISYEFKKNNQQFDIYAAYSLNTNYKLHWWLIGVSYYPFNKLR